MKNRGYQHNYSDMEPKMHDFRDREKKAQKILAIIKDFFERNSKKNTKDLSCLDLGCSLGIITKTLAPNLKKIIGIDIDQKALKKISEEKNYPNLSFKFDDALNLSFSDNYFDIVICNNVYEHVSDPYKMMSEIYRVLKKGGICYFTAINKYIIIESDYNLPFLSWLPVSLASLYLRITGKGNDYYERPLNFNQIKKMISGFKSYDYTLKVIKEPDVFKVDHKAGKLASHVPLIFLNPFKFFFPQFFWILEKE